MIKVTRLNGKAFVMNADLIEFVESTPDTLVSLTTGRKIMVLESMQDVVKSAIDYRARLRGAYPVSVAGEGSDAE